MDTYWITTNINGPMTFYWAPRTQGTDIGTDRTRVGTPDEGKVLNRVEPSCQEGLWSVRFTVEPSWDRP